MTAVKLTATFDPDQVVADCAALLAVSAGRPAGFGSEDHIGWRALTLHARGSSERSLLQDAPYLRQRLNELGLAVQLARIMVLAPGGVIREHSDAFLSSRIVRLHLPVITHKDVEFHLGGERCRWAPGELWYGDFSLPHYGVNCSPVTRVHVVIDVVADDALAALLPKDSPVRLTPEGGNDLLLDPAALDRLAFDFVLPPGFALPGVAPLPEGQPTPGTLRVVDSELRLFVDEQPMLKAVPLSETMVELLGLGFPARLVYDIEREGGRRVALEVGGVSVLDLAVSG